MTFDSLLETFGTGFALDRIDKLRCAAAGVATTKAQRKQLASVIESARSHGRVGRIANLLLIALLTDQPYWLEWLRRSAVLRPSADDLNTATLRKLMPLVRQIALAIAIPPDFAALLDHIDWLIVLADAAHIKRVNLLKLIAKDRLLVKGCLVTTDLLFIGRTDYLVKENVPLTPEDAAGALSYLVYLVQKRSGPAGISLAGIDSEKVKKGYYLSVLEETQRITDYFTWELLVFHFGYSCYLSEDRSAIQLDASITGICEVDEMRFYPPGEAEPGFRLGPQGGAAFPHGCVPEILILHGREATHPAGWSS
jgi:hypothetical protein